MLFHSRYSYQKNKKTLFCLGRANGGIRWYSVEKGTEEIIYKAKQLHGVIIRKRQNHQTLLSLLTLLRNPSFKSSLTALIFPPDYFQQLPHDLRLDLNDAAFDLSNGPVLDECGKELGEILLNLSRAWELAFGKRLISSGRRFQSMGQYGQGELQKIAQTMITTGKLLSASSMPMETDEESKKETRVFKFGELQVEITPQKANIGAVIGLVFGILSWELAQGIQSIPESSLEYANDNALLLAKSLRVALLAVCFSSALLSACTTVALFLLARQLKSKED
ncbi:hypothetical protein OIU84_017804 [Salix udensis]|uniref:Uncharacterized protein n=1 Tax=Salix udensis TaxID=889485 RepID=A0AAD6L3W5_9ROSI|nr:hypothetical protein OIU84_017804 [Salix udensis]